MPLSASAWTLSPPRLVVAPMSSTTTSWLLNGRPRQFIVMCANRRCSIRFHLLVPGGKWQTVIASPVCCASWASSHFHNRTREPFDPPASALISSRFAFGYLGAPTLIHQRRRVSTANVAVSPSAPTDTQPVFAPTSYTP